MRSPSAFSPWSRSSASVEAILLTHCHFDHIGAVAPVAAATGASVYCPDRDADPGRHHGFRSVEGFGPYESYTADVQVAGGESLGWRGSLGGDLHPGAQPGHVTYSVRGEDAIFSGDVLFQGSVGRVDLPGGDWETVVGVDPGPDAVSSRANGGLPRAHGDTTLGIERASNPFLAELAR